MNQHDPKMLRKMRMTEQTDAQWLARTAARCERVSAAIDRERALEPYELIRAMLAIADQARALYDRERNRVVLDFCHDIDTFCDQWAEFGQKVIDEANE